MAKPEWGTKRTCLSCGVRFYDLGKKPITCPSCESSFEPEAFVKTRRSRQSAPEEPKKPVAKPESPVKVAEDAAVNPDNPAVDKNNDEDNANDDGEADDAVPSAAADAGDEKNEVADLIDKPGETKEES